jgi:hypothetical protein
VNWVVFFAWPDLSDFYVGVIHVSDYTKLKRGIKTPAKVQEKPEEQMIKQGVTSRLFSKALASKVSIGRRSSRLVRHYFEES